MPEFGCLWLSLILEIPLTKRTVTQIETEIIQPDFQAAISPATAPGHLIYSTDLTEVSPDQY